MTDQAHCWHINLPRNTHILLSQKLDSQGAISPKIPKRFFVNFRISILIYISQPRAACPLLSAISYRLYLYHLSRNLIGNLWTNPLHVKKYTTLLKCCLYINSLALMASPTIIIKHFLNNWLLIWLSISIPCEMEDRYL